MPIMVPYDHDCNGCVWVGWYWPNRNQPPANVYLCGKTVIIRHSSDGSDYWSATAGDIKKGPITWEK